MLIFTGTGRSGTGLYAKLFNGYHEYKNESYRPMLARYVPDIDHPKSDPFANSEIRLRFVQELLQGVDLNTFCDSSNLYIHFLDALYALDPNVRIVLGVRDGRDFARSGITRGYHDPQRYNGWAMEPNADDPYFNRWKQMHPVEKMAWLWTSRNQKALDRLTLIPKENWMTIRLEDLTGENSGTYLAQLEEFTGRKAVRSWITVKYNANPQSNVPEKENWPPAIRDAFETIAGDMMRYFGYDMSTIPQPKTKTNQQNQTPWIPLHEIQTPVLQRNVNVLQSREHELVTLLNHAKSTDALQFQKQGKWIRCRTADEHPKWIIGETGVEQDIQTLKSLLSNQLPDTGLLLLIGGAIGYGIAEVIPFLLQRPDLRVVVVEPGKERIQACLAFVDLQEALMTERLHFTIAPINAGEIVARLEPLQLLDSFPFHAIISPELQAHINVEDVKQEYEKQSERYREKRNRIVEALRKTKPLPSTIQKVLLVNCWQNAPGGIHIQAIAQSLMRRGIQTQHLPVNRYRFDGGGVEYRRVLEPQILENLRMFQPDLVLSYGYHAPHFVSRDVFESYGAHWVQVVTNVAFYDELQFEGEQTVLMDERLTPWFKQRGYQNLHFIPLMADYLAEQPTPTNRQLPIVFVGNSLGLSEPAVQQFMKQWDGRNELVEYIRDAEAVLCDFDRQDNLYDYIENNPIPQTESVKERYEVFRYLLCQGSAARRKTILEKLAPMGLSLFGGDWDAYLPANSPLRKCLRGPLPLQEEIKAFSVGSIFVNIHSVGHVTGPNMRFFNVAGMGGFQISDAPRFDRYLSAGTENVYAKSVDGFFEKVQHYLKHPNEMDEIRARGWQRARSQWTYNHWLDELCKKLEIQIPS